MLSPAANGLLFCRSSLNGSESSILFLISSIILKFNQFSGSFPNRQSKIGNRQFAESAWEKTPHPDHHVFSGQSGCMNVAKSRWTRNETDCLQHLALSGEQSSNAKQKAVA
jgi:hypothetical protein